MLTVTPLEPRESPVLIDWLFDPDPWVQAHAGVIREAVEPLAAVVSRPDVPTLTVRVEPDPQPGALADATPYTWDDGGRIRFDTAAVQWAGVASVAAVAQHEFLHVLGVLGHSDEPDSLVNPYPLRAPRNTPSAGDVRELESLGWTVTLPPEEVYPYTEQHPYRGPLVRVGVPGGWADVPPRVAADWRLP